MISSILRGLQVIVRTIFVSLPDLASVSLLLLIVMFVFGIAGLTIFNGAYPFVYDNLGDCAVIVLAVLG